ncbi:MAG TPA: hypothetical protein VHH36_03690 [Candidatus Thermoplasmatota archaeon]|nr:hypothetical protein [Candidatus Thermoplasmatota archaeon]
MTFLRPPDDAAVVYEFFAPFAHVEGRYEWCRIRSPTHGVFDCFILLEADPVVVYVSSDAGARFMAERYPECAAFRVAPDALRIEERDGGRTVAGTLVAGEGPLRRVALTLTAPPGVPEAVPYGGQGKPVWGSRRFTCWGVDLALRGRADGVVAHADGREVRLSAEPAIVTLGSFGRIAPLDG